MHASSDDAEMGKMPVHYFSTENVPMAKLPQNGSFPSRVEMMVGTNRHYTHEAGQHGASRKELQLI
jgi:hypothetical protein